MALPLPASLKSLVERPHQPQAIVSLLEITLSKAYRIPGSDTVMPAVLARLCNYHQSLAWPASSPAGETWYPMPFTWTPITQSKAGDLPQLSVSIDNSTRGLMRYLHSGDGLESNPVKLYLIAEGGLGIAYPNQEYLLQALVIASARANDEAITLNLEEPNYFQRNVPPDRFAANRCRWAWAGLECGYVQSEVAGYTSCPKTPSACNARGLDMLSRGLPQLQPRRFGGFPGIQLGR